MNESHGEAPTEDVEVLRSACEESRAVLDDQLAELSDIGDKALWTVRTSMIVLGIVASTVSLGEGSTFEHPQDRVLFLASVGIVSLLVASIWGLGTYFVSDRVRGVSPVYRRRAQNERVSERDWYRALLQGYDQWIAEMEKITDTTERTCSGHRRHSCWGWSD